jgi:polyisoprenoid-binding protein YceI
MGMRKALSSRAIALSTLLIAAAPDPMPWNVDASHSGIHFTVNHFFTPVTGQFTDYEIDLSFDRERPENSTVRVEIDVASVETGNDDRDAHLLSADFFDAERFPTITFESDEVRRVGGGALKATGTLRIRDESRRVELPIERLGVKDIPSEMRAMLGGVEQIASFRSQLRIDRSDYGVGSGSWAAALVVGHDVDIEIAIEANR